MSRDLHDMPGARRRSPLPACQGSSGMTSPRLVRDTLAGHAGGDEMSRAAAAAAPGTAQFEQRAHGGRGAQVNFPLSYPFVTRGHL